MREVNPKEPTKPLEWEIVIFSCSMCGRLWRFDSAEEAEDSLEMWGLGAFAYYKTCKCGQKLAVEAGPLLRKDKALFMYIYELEQRVKEGSYAK